MLSVGEDGEEGKGRGGCKATEPRDLPAISNGLPVRLGHPIRIQIQKEIQIKIQIQMCNLKWPGSPTWTCVETWGRMRRCCMSSII